MKKRQKTKVIVYSSIMVYFVMMFILQHVEHASAKRGLEPNIHNMVDAMWYSIVTLTTVGYGDHYPVTAVGKIIGLVLVLGSIGIMGYIIGTLSGRYQKYLENKRLGLLGTKMENHVVIIGWDDFARQVVNQIVQANNEVAIVTNKKNDIDLINDLFGEDKNVFCLFADYNNIEALSSVNIEKSNNIFLNLDDDTTVLVQLLNIKKEFPEKDIVVSLNNSDLKETFAAAGVTHVVSKNDIASKLVASYVFEPDVASFTEDIMASAVHFTNDFDMMQFLVIEGNPYINKDCGYVFLDMKQTYDAIFMGITKNENNKWNLYKNPSKDISINEGDYIIIVSNIQSREKVEADFGIEEGKI